MSAKTGRLGTAVLTANIANPVYKVPATVRFVTTNFSIVNTGTVAAKIRVAYSLATVEAGVTRADYIEYDFSLEPSGVLERTNIDASSGETLFFTADQDNVVVRVHGLEDIIVD